MTSAGVCMMIMKQFLLWYLWGDYGRGIFPPLDLNTRHATSILPSIGGTDPTWAIKPCKHCKKNPTTTDGDSEVTHTCNQGAHYHHVGSHCASKVEKKKYDIITKFWEI